METKLLQEISRKLSSLEQNIGYLHAPSMCAEPSLNADEIQEYISQNRTSFVQTSEDCEVTSFNPNISASVVALALEIATMAMNNLEFVQAFIYYSGDARDINIRVFELDPTDRTLATALLIDENIFFHNPNALKLLLDVKQRLAEVISNAHAKMREVMA